VNESDEDQPIEGSLAIYGCREISLPMSKTDDFNYLDPINFDETHKYEIKFEIKGMMKAI